MGNRLAGRLFLPFASIVTIGLIAVTIAAYDAIRHTARIGHEKAIDAHLIVAARTIRPQFLALEPRDENWRAELQKTARQLSRQIAMRVTVAATDGQILADSSESVPPTLGAEWKAARDGQVGRERRWSHTWQEYEIAVAAPVIAFGEVAAVVRVAVPESGLDAPAWPVWQLLGVAGAVGIGVLVFGWWWLRRIVSVPLGRMRKAAQTVAKGDLATRLPVPPIAEMAELAHAINEMAAELAARISALAKQRNEQQAVFASMTEGVVAVDTRENVLAINRAATDLFGLPSSRPIVGRSIFEAIRTASLHRFVHRALTSQTPIEDDITLHGTDDVKFIEAHGTPLRDAVGATVGAVVVFTDITRLHKLETMRRDFVANVSHELRTPITSIKGFVETLLDGALQNPADAERFVRIISRHADRLHAMIEDLLWLSRIESAAETGTLDRTPEPIATLLHDAVSMCETTATGSSPSSTEIRVAPDVVVECEPNLTAPVNARLVEQAVVNVVENALKYSPNGGTVRVIGRRIRDAAGEWAEIAISDHGIGIAPEHVPRLFERFYRVDKGRSRHVGGTGLGLAIVKHIVHAHAGTIAVESQLGRGSTFTLRFPIPPIPPITAGR